MTRSFSAYRWLRWSLLIIVLTGLALVIPTVNAHIPKGSYSIQQEETLPKASSALSPVSAAPDEKTKTNTDLPSKGYSVVVDVQDIAYSLESLDLNAIGKTRPNQIGVGRTINIFSENYGRLFQNNDGSKIRILAIRSPGALAIRVHFERFDIPIEDRVYVYGVSAASYIAGPYSRRGPFGDEEFWTDTIEGDTVVIEHFTKSAETSLNISEISHIYASIPGNSNETAPDVLACHNDAMCFNDVERDAVGRITYVDDADGLSYVCSGTMLTDRTVDFAPYFLTANHCISSLTEARTVETFWFYRTTACNSGIVSGSWRRTPTGASLLATRQAADSSLLRIHNTVPGGLAYSGWDPNAKSVNTQVFGFHHPGNGTPVNSNSGISYLRRSSGPIAATNSSCSDTGLANGYNVDWNSGLTEPGSSGSGLFFTQNGQNYLVGVLSCGPVTPSCADLSLYGKFSDFYSTAQTYLDDGDSGGNCAPSAISVGQTINGVLATTDCKSRARGVSFFADRYSFNGTTGQQVAVLLTSSVLDTYVYLLGPDKSVAAQDDDGGVGTNSRIPPGSGLFSLPSSGTYVIEVTSFDQNTTGSYTLSLSGSGCPITVGQGTAGSELTAFQNAYNSAGGQPVLGCPSQAVQFNGFTSFAGTIGYYQLCANGDLEYLTNGSRTGQAYGVANPLYTKWASFGFNSSNPLGYPIGNLSSQSTSCFSTNLKFQQFEGGALEWHLSGSRAGSVYEVHGAIYTKWGQKGFAGCPLGLPISDERNAQPSGATGRTGRVSDFEGGHIHWWTNATQAFETHGAIDSLYTSMGGTVSFLGFPTSDEFTTPPNNYARNDFEGGFITTTDGVNYRAFRYTSTLTIASTNPSSGVSITVTPTDNNGQGSGVTQFTRTYNSLTGVTLTAPSTAGGNNFQKWQLDGVDFTTSLLANFVMDANHTMTALYSGGGELLLLSETFSGGIPPTWSVIDGGSGGGAAASWTTANPGGRFVDTPFSGAFAIVDSDIAGINAVQDEQLITPVINATGCGQVILEFTNQFQWFNQGLNEIADVDVSTNGGTTWTNVLRLQGAHDGFPTPNTKSLNITSAIGANRSNVRIRFHYYNANFEWWWAIDNVKVRCLSATGSSPFDFDGDGRTDIAVFRPSDGFWFILQSSDHTQRPQQWGISTDKLVPGDYDGDGRTDIAVFRPSNGVWYILQSTSGFMSQQFAAPGDVPVPGDYDGDGKTDIAVFHPSDGTWRILKSSDHTQRVQQWGASTDKLVPADYDGDGTTDIAVFRPSNGVWYILQSSNGFSAQQFAAPGDIPVPGDYDGDGKADIAVFHPSDGYWFILKSSDHTQTLQQWGASSDKLVPGDYDGDGRTDIAVFRPSNGVWYILQSSNGFAAQQFAVPGDLPVPSAYIQ